MSNQITLPQVFRAVCLGGRCFFIKSSSIVIVDTYSPNLQIGLRDHLLAAQASQPQSAVEIQQPTVLVEPHIDPQIAGPSYAAAVASAASSLNSDPMEHQSPGTRKGRKELANTKRAAQNRAAQVSNQSVVAVHPLPSSRLEIASRYELCSADY